MDLLRAVREVRPKNARSTKASASQFSAHTNQAHSKYKLVGHVD